MKKKTYMINLKTYIIIKNKVGRKQLKYHWIYKTSKVLEKNLKAKTSNDLKRKEYDYLNKKN